MMDANKSMIDANKKTMLDANKSMMEANKT